MSWIFNMINNAPFLSLLLVSSALAKPITFDFEDPKGVNSIIFHLDAPLESINGSGDKITGSVQFDPDQPEATSGEVILESSSLHVGNSLLKEHMHGENWMDVEKYPTIRFSFQGLNDLIKVKDSKSNVEYTAVADGKMTVKNTTIAMKIPVKVSFLAGLLEKRNRVPGDLLVVRSRFSVKRDDFEIQKGENLEKVANEIEIILNLAGAAPYK